MIDCLFGYIGLSSAYDKQPAESGLYVDALPDISYANIERLTHSEQDADDLWTDIEKRAIYKFRTMFIREVNKCHSLNDVSKCECLICNNRELLSTALWYLIGAEVMYTRQTSSRQNTYTSLDHGKARDIRTYFEEQFERELEVAVRGIDIHHSPCFETPCEQPDEKDVIRTIPPIL